MSILARITCACIFMTVPAFSAVKNILVTCKVAEGSTSSSVVYRVQNPYGGGKVINHKLKNGGHASIVVMLEVNETNKQLFDMTLLLSTNTRRDLIQTVSRGVAEDMYRDNGASLVLYADKNGKLENSLAVNCGI